LWIDAICGSVQNSMTPAEKSVVPIGSANEVGKVTQGGLYPTLEKQELIEAKVAGREPS
jgi:hypothetical protein